MTAHISKYAYFPSALPDELPYSMVARYKSLLGMRFAHSFKKDLGIPRHMSAVSPYSIKTFVARTQLERVTPEGFLASHTIHPYISAFMSETERAQLQHLCLSGFGGTKLLRRESKATTRRLSFCSSCVTADVNACGQSGMAARPSVDGSLHLSMAWGSSTHRTGPRPHHRILALSGRPGSGYGASLPVAA